MRLLNALLIAFSTYSRIPVPKAEWSDENRRCVMCFFPLIGAMIGLLLWGWLRLCEILPISALLRGSVTAAIPLLVSGGIHMDGFMDTCDALASWQPKQRRLEILKDSHAGAFAVMGCGLYLLLDAAILSEAKPEDAPLLACVFILSRALSAWLMTMLKSARPGGMLDGFAKSAAVRRVTISSAVYTLCCAVIWIMLGGWTGAACLMSAAICVLGYRHMAYKQFGGITGDLAGWFLQITELCLAAVIIIGGKML